jgi:hypothetical protein
MLLRMMRMEVLPVFLTLGQLILILLMEKVAPSILAGKELLLLLLLLKHHLLLHRLLRLQLDLLPPPLKAVLDLVMLLRLRQLDHHLRSSGPCVGARKPGTSSRARALLLLPMPRRMAGQGRSGLRLLLLLLLLLLGHALGGLLELRPLQGEIALHL